MRYVSLVKPGILMGNAITLVGGYCFAVHGRSSSFLPLSLIFALLGMCLVIASGCVFNNFIDRDIDALMERTKHRVSVLGLVPLKSGLCYGVALGIAGLVVLYFLVNPLAAVASMIGWFVYVVAYSLWFKRQSVWGTAVGGVAGAMPIVVGYLAATGQVNWGAWVVFALLFCWQLPHSYAIAIYRQGDYRAASIPVLPLRVSIYNTKCCMMFFVIATLVFAILPYCLGWLNSIYGLIVFAVCAYWLWLSFGGFRAASDVKWARRMFLSSILVMNGLCLAMIVS